MSQTGRGREGRTLCGCKCDYEGGGAARRVVAACGVAEASDGCVTQGI